MAHAVPKIEYQVIEVTGDTTITNTTLSNLSSTESVEAGMFIRGTGITEYTTVISKTATSVVMSANATASGTGVDIEFFKKIEFSYPPIENMDEKRKPQTRRSTSLSGETQISTDHIELVRDLKFSFLTASLFLAVQSFFDNNAVFGDDFRLYDDKTTSSYNTYELNSFTFDPEKNPSNGGAYRYAVPLSIRRVL